MSDITVVIPTIGRELYLERAVMSVLEQDYFDIQVVVSDNDSKEPVESMLRSIKDERLSIKRRNKRLSFVEHWNLCIAEVKTKYVMMMSDDDLLSTGYISAMLKLYNMDPEIGFAIGNGKIIGENEFPAHTYENRAISIISCEDFFRDKFIEPKLNLPTLTYIFAKTADILKAGKFDIELNAGNLDNLLALKLAFMNKKVGLSDEVYFYRVYASSFGLSVPFKDLVECYEKFELKLFSLLNYYREELGELNNIHELMTKIHSLNRRLLIQRFINYYLRSKGPFNNLLLVLNYHRHFKRMLNSKVVTEGA